MKEFLLVKQVKIPVRDISTSMPRTRIQNTTVHMLVFAKKKKCCTHELSSTNLEVRTKWRKMKLFGRSDLSNSISTHSILVLSLPYWSYSSHLVGPWEDPPTPILPPPQNRTNSKQTEKVSGWKLLDRAIFNCTWSRETSPLLPLSLSLHLPLLSSPLFPYQGIQHTITLKLHKLELEKKR